MKRKIALVAGCSHSVGSEIDGTEDSEFNRKNSFGGLLANKLGRETINIAMPAGTNGSIARSILNWFKHNYDAETMDVFVIVGWTDSCRVEVPYDEQMYYDSGNPAIDWYDKTANNYLRVLFGWEGTNEKEKEICKFFHEVMARHEGIMEIWSLNCILQVQYFLKSMNVDYVMTSAMNVYTYNNTAVKPYLDLVDDTRYYDITSDGDKTFYWKYRNLGHTNEKAKYWHHGIEPHRLYAEELYNFVKEHQNV